MKYVLIALSVILVLFIISQIWAKSTTTGIEMYPYNVLEEYDGFEVRQYEAANFTYVTMDKTNYSESSRTGFRALAGYIFGGNADNKEIAMTSPVEMEMKDSVTMKFMVPEEYVLEELPAPNNARVKFKKEPQKTLAVVQFGGWANDEKIEKYTAKLKKLLEQEGIEHKNNFSFFGYDPPFVLFNRRNEVAVEVIMEK